jgi:hypothetical protein
MLHHHATCCTITPHVASGVTCCNMSRNVLRSMSQPNTCTTGRAVRLPFAAAAAIRLPSRAESAGRTACVCGVLAVAAVSGSGWAGGWCTRVAAWVREGARAFIGQGYAFTGQGYAFTAIRVRVYGEKGADLRNQRAAAAERADGVQYERKVRQRRRVRCGLQLPLRDRPLPGRRVIQRNPPLPRPSHTHAGAHTHTHAWRLRSKSAASSRFMHTAYIHTPCGRHQQA